MNMGREKKRRGTNLWITLCGLFLVGGCDSKPLELENLCQELQQSVCAYLERCDLSWMIQLGTHRTCEQMIECDAEEYQKLAKSLDAKRLAFDGNLARSCLNQIRSASCFGTNDITETLSEECSDVITGLVASGGDCYLSQDCAPGLYCDESASDCPGKCQPYQAIDQPCTGNLKCDPDVADCHRQLTTCAKLASVSESCEFVDCQAELFCNESAVPPTCQTPGAESAPCSSSLPCQSPLACIGEKCTQVVGRGEACDLGKDFEGAILACEPGLFCDANIAQGEKTGTCQPKKKAGEECLLFYQCSSGLLCLGAQMSQTGIVPGSCKTPLQTGDECQGEKDFLTECNWDLFCDDQTLKCTPFPVLGDPCVPGDNLRKCSTDNLYCDSFEMGVPGTCQQRKPDDAGCTNAVECQSRICSQDKCQKTDECVVP